MSQNATAPRIPHRFSRIAGGAAALAILAAALFWSIANYLPHTPRIASGEETPSQLTAVSFGVPLEAETVEQIPCGKTVVLDSLTRGNRYELGASPYLQESFEQLSDAEQRDRRESEEWDYDLPAFAATVESAHLLSESAFAEWYPAWRDADISGVSYREEDMKFMVVKVIVTNLGNERIVPEYPVLRSPLFHGDNNLLSAGMFVDQYAEYAVYPFYSEDAPMSPGDYTNPEANLGMTGLNGEALMLDPDETKTLTYSFIVYRNSFSDPEAIDSLTLSDFALAYLDYSPWSIIELELA